MLKNWLWATLVALMTLAACGGGGDGIPDAVPSSTFDPTRATPTNRTIDNRKVTLVVPVGILAPTAGDKEQLLKWVEKWDKETHRTFFPAGPTTQTGTFGGESFVYRVYPTGASIRIRDDGAVFVWWPDGTIRQHGWFPRDYFCQINDCVAPATAGKLTFASDPSGASLVVAPNLKGNLITALGDEINGVGVGFEIPAEDVDEICPRSNRLNNWGKRGGIGCSKPLSDGTWRVTRLANNDCVRVVVWTKSGEELWLDFTAARGWKVEGLNADTAQACGISYGANGFTQAKTSTVREADGTATLVWDFGYYADWLAGIGPTPIDLSDKAITHAFALNGNRQGKDYGPGWGLGDGRKTPEGFLVEPSIRKAWLETNPANGNHVLRFKGLACTDKVSVTAYRGTGPAANVVYDFGADGFGLGWANVGGANPYWMADVGTFLISETSQVEYGVPFCTQK